jgi:hypothetical protein
MPIADRVQECLQQFDLIRHNEEIYEISKEAKVTIDESFDRFTIWKNNIGAHRTDTASLEYRLRDASHIKEMIEESLQDIILSLSDANEIITGDKTPWEENIHDNVDDCGPEDGSDSDPESDRTELYQISTYVLETVKSLLRLSITIKNPAPFDRFLRSREIDITPFETFDIGHTKSKLPLAEDFLLQRLGKANSKRRAYFKYREEHRERLEKDLGPDNRTIASSLPAAVDIIPPFDRYEDNASVTSYARTEITPSNSISVPRMPREAEDGQPFECPFCFSITMVRTKNEWK